MLNRPLSLIEILVAEYDAQAEMNSAIGWTRLPLPYTNKKEQGEESLDPANAKNTISEICDEIHDDIYGTAQSSEKTEAEKQEHFCCETDKYLAGFYDLIHQRAKEDKPRAALCFSGGGIRSATFALGLMQGLVGRGVELSRFHFLSTVSGGGYIGSWLSAWIHRQGIERVQRGLSPPDKRRRPDDNSGDSETPFLPSDPEPETIRHLRRYSNYMSPRYGLFSADTWALVGTFLRNLLLNWTVLIPLLLTAMAIPRLAMSIASWNCPRESVEKVVIAVAFIAGVICIAYMVASTPSWRSRSRLTDLWKSESRFLWCCWLMLTLSAFLSAVYWAWIHIPQGRCVNLFGASIHESVPFILFGTLISIVGYLIGRLALAKLDSRGLAVEVFDPFIRTLAGALGGFCLWVMSLAFQPAPILIDSCSNGKVEYSKCAPAPTLQTQLPGSVSFPIASLPARIDVAIVPQGTPSPTPQAQPSPVGEASLPIASQQARIDVSVISQPSPTPQVQTSRAGGVNLSIPSLPARIDVSVVPQPTPDAKSEAKRISIEAGLYTAVGPSLFLLMFLLAATIFIGLASTLADDADREWMARAGGWMLISVFGWSAFCALVIFGPVGLIWLWREFTVSLLSVGTISGLLTLFGGFSSKTSANKKPQSGKKEEGISASLGQLLTTSLPLAATVFAMLILAALSLATSGLIAAAYANLKNHGALFGATSNLLAALRKMPWLGELVPNPQRTVDGMPSDLEKMVGGMPWLSSFSAENTWWHLEVLLRSPAVLVVFVIVLILLVGLLMGVGVNINKFSLHAAYRDRLIRAYLGASNTMRRPNPFTGFDELDNVQMHNLLTEQFRPKNFADSPLAPKIAALNIDAEKRTQRGLKPSNDPEKVRQIIVDFIRPGFLGLLSEPAQNLIAGYSHAAPVNDNQIRQTLADEFNRIIQAEELLSKSQIELLEECPKTGDQEIDELIELIRNQPTISLLPIRKESFWWWLRKERKVIVQKMLINRKLIEIAFNDLLTSPSRFAKEARPLHVVNIALNLVGGKDLAWQERKAQPFTVSPLHAGSYGLGYRDVKEYAVSRQQNAALSLGTSLAISGAAVSPNMGFNSSSAVTFLLMLFNVRLGWWLGNPGWAGQETHTKPGPFFTPEPLIAETLGMTDSLHPYVYLSDGAHFENLALYEMVRRRCHFIVVSDAGADGDFKFDDLGNALRKIRIDLGVPIEMWKMPIQPRVAADKLFAADGKAAGKYCALGTIRYSAVDGHRAEDGVLVYIKPTAYGIEPPDVQNYAKSNEDFPHETTGDQMYSESQFESYRALGSYVISEIASRKEGLDIKALFREIHHHLEKPVPKILEGPTPSLPDSFPDVE